MRFFDGKTNEPVVILSWTENVSDTGFLFVRIFWRQKCCDQTRVSRGEILDTPSHKPVRCMTHVNLLQIFYL